jgi:hypothetical protein
LKIQIFYDLAKFSSYFFTLSGAIRKFRKPIFYPSIFFILNIFLSETKNILFAKLGYYFYQWLAVLVIHISEFIIALSIYIFNNPLEENHLLSVWICFSALHNQSYLIWHISLLFISTFVEIIICFDVNGDGW